MLKKIRLNLVISNKRDRKLVTPCCNKLNADGKFVNYKNLPPNYGYCHSCGKTSLPPTLYQDEDGTEYIWNDHLRKFETAVTHLYYKNVIQTTSNVAKQCITNGNEDSIEIKYIDFEIVKKFCYDNKINALLNYLVATFGLTKATAAKNMYYIGTSKDNGTIFWSINIHNQAQKAKVPYYNSNGKRTNRFKVPYKNEDGYYSCLFGEHLLGLKENIDKQIVLVESEKTALVCSMEFPDYVWLAYGGKNGLTDIKTKILSGKKIIIIPDISQGAVNVMKAKIPYLHSMNIEAHIWDMTEGKTDEQLKKEGIYEYDLEDILKDLV